MREMKKRFAALTMAASLLLASLPAPSLAEAAAAESPAPAVEAQSAEPAQTRSETPAPAPVQTAAEPTPAPSSEQTPDAESAPSSAASATPDAETSTPDASASATPDASASPTPAPVGEGPAWFWDGAQKRYGQLEELLLQTHETIYIASDEVFVLTGEAAQRVQEASLALDAEAFPEADGYVINLSDIGPNGEAQEGAIYVWAGPAEDVPPTPTPSPTAPAQIEAELLVIPEMYQAGAWTAVSPSFTLSVVPDTLEGYAFAVSVDGGAMQAVESPFVFAEEGRHELVFALVDPNGAQAARSTTYTVWLDATAPEAQAQFDMQSGTLTVTASDAGSGVDAVSLDGGKTWLPMTAGEDGAYAYSAALAAQVAAGDLMVRDAAGNLWQSMESYGAPGGMGGDFGGMGGMGGMGSIGGGGGSSGTTRTVSHSSGSAESATAYGAVALEVDESSMFALTLGGEELSLTLVLDYAADGVADAAAEFTAELAVWNGDGEDGDYDTLILTASDAGAESPYAYRWDFSGDVYKTLFNSGVQYLVLRVGDRVTALSTAGFTAGTAYNALKSAGAASGEFHYSLWMGEPDPALELEVEARGERYLLEAGEGEMYYYDVYAGDMNMLSAAFGAARQEEP